MKTKTVVLNVLFLLALGSVSACGPMKQFADECRAFPASVPKDQYDLFGNRIDGKPNCDRR